MKSLSIKSFLAIVFILIVISGCKKDDDPTLIEKIKSITYLTENFAPFNFEENFEFRGISADLLSAIFTKMNINTGDIELKMSDWAVAYVRVLNEENTMLFSMAKTTDREELFKWVGPIALIKDVVISSSGQTIEISSASDLSTYTFAVIDGYSTIEILEEEGVPNSNLVLVSGVEELYQKLMNGDVDCIAYSKNGHNLIYSSLGYTEDQFEIEYDLTVMELHYAFNINTDNDIIDYFQEKLDEIKNDKTEDGSSVYEKILNDYNVIQSYDDGITEEMVINLVNTTSENLEANTQSTVDAINQGLPPYKDPSNSALYSFVYDTTLTIVAHATNSLIVGINFRGKPDVAGNLFRDKILEGALENGTGWVDYIYTRPDQSGLYHKTSYYKLTTGSDGELYIVCAGRYK